MYVCNNNKQQQQQHVARVKRDNQVPPRSVVKCKSGGIRRCKLGGSFLRSISSSTSSSGCTTRVHTTIQQYIQQERLEKWGRKNTIEWGFTPKLLSSLSRWLVVVVVVHCRRRVSWPDFTQFCDSYAVDITIMECVRLPLCLSLHPPLETRMTSSIYSLIHIPVSYTINLPSLLAAYLSLSLSLCVLSSFVPYQSVRPFMFLD